MQAGTEPAIESLLADLSDPQREAVTHTEGPLLILAGPGSGKTRVVTRRAAHLARTVTDPHHILAITFTNKAAREMQERIEMLAVGRGITVSTFHAWCARLLRRYHQRAAVPPNFTIFDRQDRRKLLEEAIVTSELSTSNWSPRVVESVISRAKNDMRTAGDFADGSADWQRRTIARIYLAYEDLLTRNGGLDFDDLLMRVAMLLGQDSDLRDELEDRYRYVLVDEYQDTNAAQYLIVHELTRRNKNLCATGDPDQSIYGWRGANIRNILSFEQDHPGAKVIRLEQNYRSTKRILAAADALIAGNVNRKIKTLWTQNEDGPAVDVVEGESGEEEAETVATEIARQLRNGVQAGDVAVFYRINSLSRVIEEALIREGIAYQVARGVEFYNRKEIKDVLAYLRVLINPADDTAMLRVINTPPRGIGSTTVGRLTQRARAGGRSIFELLTSGDDLTDVGRSVVKVSQFADLLGELAPALELGAREALEQVISRSGLRALYRSDDGVDSTPDANLDELISAASRFQQASPEATILDWLEHTALLSDVDTVRSQGGLVTLMTLHAAKGLEFPVVFVIGLEEGIIPFRRHEDDEFDEEEERRLLFVGMTRARERLILSYARYRMLRGRTDRTVRSPFLDELPRDQIEWTGIETLSSPGGGWLARGKLPDDVAEWTSGTLVRHPVHGLGKILSLRYGSSWTRVEVQFESGLPKTLALEYADLVRVDFDDVG